MGRTEGAGFPEPPLAGDEVATLLGSLERQRATFVWKTAGLDEAGLNATVGASSVTLGGLLKHLAFMEDLNFSKVLLGRDLGPPWDAVDWGAPGQQWDWRTTGHSPEQLYTLWRQPWTGPAPRSRKPWRPAAAWTSRSGTRSPTLMSSRPCVGF